MSALTPDNVLLGLIAIAPKHGYQLLACFENTAQLGRVWKLSTSQIYNVLKRLENQSLITGNPLVSDNSPARIEYHLTPAGKNQLMVWLTDTCPSPSVRKIRVEFISRLYIAHELNYPTNDIITYQRQVCLQEHDRLQTELAKVPIGMDTLVLEFTIAQLQAILGWLNQCDQLFSGEIK